MKTALLLIDIQNDYFPGGQIVAQRTMDTSRHASSAPHIAYFPGDTPAIGSGRRFGSIHPITEGRGVST